MINGQPLFVCRRMLEGNVPVPTEVPVLGDQVPPKPQPKECTRPEPFHLESLVRHEDELQRIADEEKARAAQEAAARAFRALPNLSK